MAIRLICDGCGKVEDNNDFESRGFVLTKQRHYCPECDKIVARWLAARDELHTNLADRWAAGLAALTLDFFDEYGAFELPDIDRARGEVENAD